ncbi:MAG: YggS family pyridoxal phosphate-dependent enzyme [Candidatus Gastranaerophilaceae bacterium]
MTVDSVNENLLRVRKTIVPYTPNIIAVTKYYGLEAILDAYGAGLRDFGESRVNDAIQKIDNLPDDIRKESRFHFIGHLQTNKVDKVVKYFDIIQSVDSLRLACAISESAKRLDKVQKVLLQINISQEVQKFGFEKRELYNCFEQILSLENLAIEGFMCMAPLGASNEELDNVFSEALQIKTELNTRYNLNLKELSMGMSDDYQRAVANGATMIRLGRILFK